MIPLEPEIRRRIVWVGGIKTDRTFNIVAIHFFSTVMTHTPVVPNTVTYPRNIMGHSRFVVLEVACS